MVTPNDAQATAPKPRAKAKAKQFDIRAAVRKALAALTLDDFHTHFYSPNMVGSDGKPLLLTSLEDLLTYHYLVCEVVRVAKMTVDSFNKLEKREKAKLIWDELFQKRSPVTEAALGVATALHRLGISIRTDYETLEAAYAKASKGDFVSKVFKLAGIRSVYQTNDPLDPNEVGNWTAAPVEMDPRFHTVLRLDSAIGGKFAENVPKLVALGYEVTANLTDRTKAELRRYLEEWTAKLNPTYLAISLPPEFSYPTSGNGNASAILRDVVLPFARQRNLPVALMIGVRRQVNPDLGQAGDGYGRTDVRSLEELAKANPDIRFYVTLLHRDDQHPLIVAARKFKNIVPFGTWWFVNIPEVVKEITAMRIEALGFSFIPWHSDSRHLVHLLYKRKHFERALCDVLVTRYELLAEVDGLVNQDIIDRDVAELFRYGMPA